MSRSMRDVGDHVMLSSMLLKHLKKLSESPIKVYIYLCSCKQPVTASIEMISGAVGLKRRATIDALNTLENLKLISRSAGKGNAPNEYSVLFSASKAAPAAEPPVNQPVVSPQPLPIGKPVASPEAVAVSQPTKNSRRKERSLVESIAKASEPPVI